MKPTPTEYKGIRFRSKSEAVFAYAIEQSRVGIWVYEPFLSLPLDGYTPDFLLCIKSQKSIGAFLIELKPSKPTDTYIEECERRFTELTIRQDTGWLFPCCSLIYGTPFDDRFDGYKCMLWSKIGRWEEFGFSSLTKHAIAGTRHRFDLRD